MKAFLINIEENTVRAFGSMKAARSMGNAHPIVSSVDELVENKNIPTSAMVTLYNALTNESVNRFSDRTSGAKRLFGALEALEAESGSDEDDTLKASGAKATKAKKEKAEGSGEGRGRKKGSGEFASKTIIALKDVNPRRPGSHGFRSYEIIREAGNNGIAYADYIEAGGRPNDLRWDIERKWAKVV